MLFLQHHYGGFNMLQVFHNFLSFSFCYGNIVSYKPHQSTQKFFGSSISFNIIVTSLI